MKDFIKTTPKEFQKNVVIKAGYKKTIRLTEQMIQNCENTLETDKEGDIARMRLKELEDTYFSKLAKTNVSFWCGQRTFYREVIKIGKSYYDRGEKMTKGAGYRFVEEIKEITEKMTEEMIADSYYY